MPVFYVLDTAASGQFLNTQQDGVAPTDAAFATATGWILSNTAGGNSAEMDSLNERATNQFTSDATTPKPASLDSTLGNAWRTPTALFGTFPAANWTLSMAARSVTAASLAGVQFGWRVYATANPAGTSGLREATSGRVLSATSSTAWSTTANQTISATWAAPAVSVANEYLFFALALVIVTNSGTGTTRDINLRKNAASAVTTPTLGALDLGVLYQRQTLAYY